MKGAGLLLRCPTPLPRKELEAAAQTPITAPETFRPAPPALEMAHLFAVLFCFENEIRDFIREALQEKEGADWQDKLPSKIKEQAESRPRRP